VPHFVDTNVLLYSVSTDPGEATKRAAAEAIFDRRDLAVSAQVLGEFYVQATRPSRSGSLTHQQATDVVISLGRYPVQPLTEALVTAALALKERYRISYWDAAILEAARAAGCDEVLSEDLSDGQDYDGITVRNPFA
jgi:predicted nucleic acid-binding protein